MLSNFIINNTKYNLNINGKIIKSENKVIINEEENLIEKTEWAKKGYTVKKLLNFDEQRNLQKNIISFVKKRIVNLFPHISFEKYKIDEYHKVLTDKEHYTFIKDIENGIKFDDINFDKSILEKAVSKIIKTKVSTKNYNSIEINDKSFALRVIRPSKTDYNPPHKDIYLDRLKNALNIYMPIVGSNNKSSLPLMPGSHLLNESDITRTENGANVNNIKFRVPCIINTKKGLQLIRPNPNYNEIMIFSPYMIHGGGLNENKDTTRMSLELRFWKV